MATKYRAIIGPPMVNAPAQHPENALHTRPEDRDGFSFTRRAKNRKYTASATKNAPKAMCSVRKFRLPSRLMTTRLHTVYRAMGRAICFRSICLRYSHVIVPDWAAQISATSVGATVMS